MVNTGFTVNTRRFDPYKNFKFKISWDDKTVLGISKVGALKRTTEVVSHHSGGENSIDHKSPGRTSYDGITVERTLAADVERTGQTTPTLMVRAFGTSLDDLEINFAKPKRPFLITEILQRCLYEPRGSRYTASISPRSSTNTSARLKRT